MANMTNKEIHYSVAGSLWSDYERAARRAGHAPPPGDLGPREFRGIETIAEEPALEHAVAAYYAAYAEESRRRGLATRRPFIPPGPDARDIRDTYYKSDALHRPIEEPPAQEPYKIP